jgi:hypothetical protein
MVTHRSAHPGGSSSGVLFGGNGSLTADQSKLGRKLAIVRIYDTIGNSFPDRQDSQLMAEGTTLLVSLDSNGASFASIAAGAEDSAIRSFFEAVNHAAVQYRLSRIFVTFEHEPDSPQHRRLGPPAEFVRAWDHVHQLAQSAHLNWNDGGRLHWVLIMIRSSYPHSWASRFWPGKGEVDIVGVDGYNSAGCSSSPQREPETPASLFDSALSYASAHGGLPVFIAEWGSVQYPAGIQPKFIREVQAYIAAHRVIAAAMYWDYYGPTCDYRVDNQPAALKALAAMGHSSVMGGWVSR